MPCKEKHIVFNPDRVVWDSKKENAERVSKHFETKKEVMDLIRENQRKGTAYSAQNWFDTMILTGKKRLNIQ